MGAKTREKATGPSSAARLAGKGHNEKNPAR
jgi:hypothetical protein